MRQAIARAQQSREEASALLEAGFPSAAYVWAVRSVETFVKEVMLLPLFLEQNGGDWRGARKQIRATFGSGSWRRAIREVDSAYGPLDRMLTEDDEDVWEVWNREIVRFRGEIVHGTETASARDAELVIEWAHEMSRQLLLRLIVAEKHPLHDFFVQVLATAKDVAARQAE